MKWRKQLYNKAMMLKMPVLLCKMCPLLKEIHLALLTKVFLLFRTRSNRFLCYTELIQAMIYVYVFIRNKKSVQCPKCQNVYPVKFGYWNLFRDSLNSQIGIDFLNDVRHIYWLKQKMEHQHHPFAEKNKGNTLNHLKFRS